MKLKTRHVESVARRPVSASVAVASALAFAAGALFPAGAFARPTGTHDVVLTMKIRDFPDTHPDFCKTLTVGQNWVEMAVGHDLDAQGRPVYTGLGKRLTVPATDAQGKPISLAVMQETAEQNEPGVFLVSAPSISSGAKIDTYNPFAGPYGGGNVGESPSIGTSQPMPSVTVPSISPNVGVYTKTGSGTTIVSSNFRCTEFTISNGHRLSITADVTIVVSEKFVVENSAKIEIAPGGRLTVYALKDAKFHNSVQVNMNTWDPTLFTFYKMGGLDLFLQDESQVCGTIVCPNGRVHISNSADLYGWVTSKKLHMQDGAGLHVPAPAMDPPCSAYIDDNPAVIGAANNAGITSAASFNTWFRDVPGTNMGAQARLVFHKNADGAFEFTSGDFRPIDGELMNEGSAGANRNFTLAMDGDFTYTPCTGQLFEYSGDGDAFVFINGKLVMEIAGHAANGNQYLDLDRLGLDPEVPHNFKFFYAQRSCTPAKFSVKTTIDLRTKYEVEFATLDVMD